MAQRARKHQGPDHGNLRPDRNEQRRIEAAARSEVRAGLTAEQQIARLDRILGTGKGATKERARLAKQIAAKGGKKAA